MFLQTVLVVAVACIVSLQGCGGGAIEALHQEDGMEMERRMIAGVGDVDASSVPSSEVSEETGVGDVDASSVPSSGPAVADADDVDGHGHVDDDEEEDDDKEDEIENDDDDKVHLENSVGPHSAPSSGPIASPSDGPWSDLESQ